MPIPKPRIPVIVAAAAALLWCNGAYAEFITGVSFDRQLVARTGDTAPTLGPHFAGNSLPQSETTGMSLPGGTAISATYNFFAPTEINNQVEFRIDTSYSVLGPGFVSERGAELNQVDIVFTTLTSVHFDFAFTNQAAGNAGIVAAMVNFNGPGVAINFSGAPYIDSGTNPGISIPLTSGLLAANATYNLKILMEAAGQSSESNIAGQSLFDFVLTPVPEPTTSFLLALGGLALLIYRTRLRRHR